MEFTKAVRKAVPMLISISSVSGGGKTYSALLLAAGLAGPNGRVGGLDTENGRMSLYVDSPGIVAALPNSFEIGRLDAPFSPENYATAIEVAEKCGIDVLVIDSFTHEYEGIDGVCEIAEKNKLKGMPNWAKAKMAHKRLMNRLLSTPMHIIFCLRAREKVKIVKGGNGREEVIPIGLQPIQEKNFVFEMLLSLQLDEQTHFATPIKCPEMLRHVFPGGKLITKEDGERIRQWNEAGQSADAGEPLRKRARAAAEDGMEEYVKFYGTLTAPQKKLLLDTTHAENKQIAERADKDRATQASEDNPTEEQMREWDAKQPEMATK